MAICAGFMGFPALVFLGISAIFRTARFALVGFLLWRFQEQANALVKKYFWPLTVVAITVTAIGLCIILLL